VQTTAQPPHRVFLLGLEVAVAHARESSGSDGGG
jgi:hypothetical protein